MRTFVLKNQTGQIIRFFRCETEKAYLIYRKQKKRLDICSSPRFFEKEEKSIVLIDEFEINKLRKKKPVPLMGGFLELWDEMGDVRQSLPRPVFSIKSLWLIWLSVLGIYITLAGVLYGLSQWGPVEESKRPEQQVVQIIKPPAVVLPEKVLIVNKQTFIRDSKTPVKKKLLKKSLKKMGALSALRSLSKKESRQREGLKLGSGKVSAGPGLRAISSYSASGAVQASLYSKGMITAALSSGGNIRGGGDHGTKGTEQGGGSVGYGEFTLIGSGGTEALSSSSVLSEQGGHFDLRRIIDREMAKHIGKVRKCYDTALKTERDLKGLFIIYVTINPRGVVSSQIHPSSPVRSQNISSCILAVINRIRFSIPPDAPPVGRNYAFDLRALETEGG